MTTITTKQKDIVRRWHLVDLGEDTLGRTASKIAALLIGKNKVNQSDNLDGGDYVVAINSDQIKVTGKKLTDKRYYRHSGFPGGLKEATLGEKMIKDSRKVIELAVKGMLPKNKFQKDRLVRLKTFKNETHPYQGQLTK